MIEYLTRDDPQAPPPVASSTAARAFSTLADLANRAPAATPWCPRERRPGRMSAAEIARHTALGLLKHLADQAADPYDVTATAVWRCWPPLHTTFCVPNPVGSYMGAGLVVRRQTAQPGLGLAPLTSTPPHRYPPSIETAGAAVRHLLNTGLCSAEIARRLGYAAEADLAARLSPLPSDAEYRAKYPRGRKPPRPVEQASPARDTSVTSGAPAPLESGE